MATLCLNSVWFFALVLLDFPVAFSTLRLFAFVLHFCVKLANKKERKKYTEENMFGNRVLLLDIPTFFIGLLCAVRPGRRSKIKCLYAGIC